ncbi:hypothetical protein PAXRUDRAFT_145365, partial [Paxillus rubicundulus Ve08.2h10]
KAPQVSKPSKDESALPSAPRSYVEGIERPPATAGIKDYPPKPATDYHLPEAAPPPEEKLMSQKPLPGKSGEVTGEAGGIKTGTPALPKPPAESREDVPRREGTECQAGPGEGREGKATAVGVSMLGAVAGARVLGKEEEDREGAPDDIPQGQKPQEATMGVGNLKAAGQEKGETHKREESRSYDKQAYSKETNVQEEGKKQTHTKSPPKAGYGGDYHPALLHPPPPGASAMETSPRFSEQIPPASPTSPTSKERSKSESTGKRVGFMAKVKGEVKVLAGKMTREEDKVEEGKKQMHGETQK